MKFSIGDIICAEGTQYRVIGRITYQNEVDRCNWDEYRLEEMESDKKAWLSVDDEYQEYSISRIDYRPSTIGYHEVDRGVEIVVSHEGDVDVSTGDRARFVEYEDETEELIISEEVWDDEDEWSSGHYLDEEEIWLVRNDKSYAIKKKAPAFVGIAILALSILFPMLGSLLNDIHITTTVQKYLDKSSKYTYVTSVTGNEKQKAKVYKAQTGSTVDSVSKDIILAIEGEAQYVQQDDTETDGAVAILTKKEYCIVYPAIEQGGVLVQVSNRKYAYTTDDDLYDGSQSARRYYRRFYHSTGYTSDSSTYSRYSSPYSSYSDGDISYTGTDTYGSYNSSVRQSSIAARQSSGGGLSGGK